MSNQAINAKDSINTGCANKSDITAETCEDRRYLHTSDNKTQALLCGILEAVQNGDGPSTKQADITLSATDLVRATGPLTVTRGATDTVDNATVFGITSTAGLAGENVQVIEFGEVEDASFNFPLNAPLFLGANGKVTDVPPVTGVLTQIGHSLGAGKIFLNIQDPICL